MGLGGLCKKWWCRGSRRPTACKPVEEGWGRIGVQAEPRIREVVEAVAVDAPEDALVWAGGDCSGQGVLVEEKVKDLFGAQGLAVHAACLCELGHGVPVFVRRGEECRVTTAALILDVPEAVLSFVDGRVEDDGTSFPSAAHLAAYAGLAAATRSSGSSIRGEQPSRRGNKQFKRAFFLSAFAALTDPASRTYYDKKITQGKHYTQAILCLVRRRADVLFAMLRDGT